MAFALVEGTTLACEIGAGSSFHVAIVAWRGMRVICKRLRPSAAAEPAVQAALARERELLGRAHHPALPVRLAAGSDAAGPYLIESLFEAVPVRRLLATWIERGQPVPAGLVAELARASFAALAGVHALGTAAGPLELVHGDLGPDNVLVGKHNEIHFVDFGLARWRGMDAALVGPAERGSLPYVAPELARGEVAPSQATDVFALAAAWAFAALGREPCAARDAPTMLVELAEHGLDVAALERRADLDDSVRAALARALAFEPAARLRSAADVLARLGRRNGAPEPS
jgi:serine/threonine-protein kinase